jgi:sterol desaturase/sphingolipid hydroxylase (fatty acid hydroxylase superfamily)
VFAIPEIWNHVIAWVSESAVVPTLSFLNVPNAGDPRELAEAVVIAAIQLIIIAGVLRPLETLAPAERWQDRRLANIDRTYTLLMVLGILPLFTYIVLTPLANVLGGVDTAGAERTWGLKHWMPWFEHHPYLLFFAYYVLYDFTYYCMHRMQHAVPWWWALHSLHHSQRQVNCWTNDRGSYLDSALQSVVLASVGLLIGVDPAEFALLMLLSELVQNLSHANVRIGFGRVLERIFVAPVFHRLHHMRADHERPGYHNCNFGQVFSVWDVAFGTALYGEAPRPTGVCDPAVDADNDYWLIGQQWLALKRFWGAFRRRSGWRFGDVSFGPGYEPIPDLAHSHRVDRVVDTGLTSGAYPPTSRATRP